MDSFLRVLLSHLQLYHVVGETKLLDFEKRQYEIRPSYLYFSKKYGAAPDIQLIYVNGMNR